MASRLVTGYGPEVKIVAPAIPTKPPGKRSRMVTGGGELDPDPEPPAPVEVVHKPTDEAPAKSKHNKKGHGGIGDGHGGGDEGSPPSDLIFENTTLVEHVPGAVVTEIAVEDPDLPDDSFTLIVSDHARFEIVDAVLKLKDDVEVDAVTEPTITIGIDAIDRNGLSRLEFLTITVLSTGNVAPTDITIDPLTIQEQVDAAPVGIVTVTDADLPADTHTFEVDDVRFEIVDNILKLKSGQEIVFAEEPIVNISVTAIDEGSLSVTINFVLTVVEQIIPEVNHAPTEIQLSSLIIDDLVYGDIIGTITVLDEDLPDDTITIICDDPRFVIIDNVLRLKPPYRVSFVGEPTVPIILTAHDSSGEDIAEPFTLVVQEAGTANSANAIFVAPTTLGSGVGDSFANAIGWSAINTVISNAASAGKQVLMASHLGDYTAAVHNITNGGSLGAPVQIIGCNAAFDADDVIIVGTRQDPWPVAPATGSPNGEEVFRLLSGADHLAFYNFTFRNCGNGCFRIGDNIADLTLDTITGDGVRRLIENNISGAAVTATISGMTVRNCTAIGFSRAFARIQYASTGIQFEDCLADCMMQHDSGGFATGFAVSGTANVRFLRCTSRNNWDVQASTDYWNGDGFSTEAGTTWYFEDCRATGNTDAGYDLKGTGTILNCIGADNKKNFRLWHSATMTDCRSQDPNLRGGNSEQTSLWVSEDAASNVTVTGSAFVDNETDTFVFVMKGAGSVCTVTDSSVQRNAASTLLLDPGVSNPSITVGVAPASTVIPVITGNPVADQTLECSTGTWDTPDTTYDYQWLRDGVYIDDAVASTYVTVEADVGLQISCRVFATIDGATGEATSLETAAIAPISLTALTAPSITGPPVVGGILGFVPGTYDGIPAPDLAYQWLADELPISGETGATLTLTIDLLGAAIKIEETATNIIDEIVQESDATAAVGASGSVPTLWVRPAAHGAATGFDVANAASMASIDSLISAVGPDGIINIVSDDGNYSAANRDLGHGGTSGHPVTIRGRTMADSAGVATFEGTRFIWVQPGVGTLTNPFTTSAASALVTVAHTAHGLVTGKRATFFDATDVGGITISGPYTVTFVNADSYTITHSDTADSPETGGGTVAYDYHIPTNVNGRATGAVLFGLNSGANYLTFDRLAFQRVGNGCFKVNATISGLTVTNCTFFNVQRFIEAGQNPISINGLTVTDCSGVGHSECAVRIRGQTNAVALTDCDFNSARQSGDSFAICVDGSELAYDVTLTRVIMRNTDGTYDGAGYWNGDGVKSEDGNHDWTLVDCESYGHTDGGFDMKAFNLIMTGCVAEDCKHSFRIWGQATVTDPVSRHVFKRGGTGSASHYMLPASWSISVQYPIFIRPVAVQTGASAIIDTQNDSQGWFREIDDSAAVGGTYGSFGTTVIYSAADVTPCTVTTSDTFEIFDGAPFSTALTSNEAKVLWKISGGDDGARFTQNYHTIAMTAKQSGTPVDADLDSVYEVEVSAKDPGDQDTTKVIAVSVVPPYVQAVTFDGTNDWFTRDLAIGPQGDVPYFFAACRIKFNGGDGARQDFSAQSGGVLQLYRNTSNKLFCLGLSGSNQLSITSNSTYTVADGWIDFMLQMQTNFAAGLKIARLWKRVSGGPWFNDAGTIVDASPSFSINYNNRNSFGCFATYSGSNKFNGDVSDFFLSFASGPDPSVQAVRDKFSLDDGTWVYPGDGGSTLLGYYPRFALQGNASTYGNPNKGTAGAVVLHGTLVDSIDPPP